jgi:hypothetical protein
MSNLPTGETAASITHCCEFVGESGQVRPTWVAGDRFGEPVHHPMQSSAESVLRCGPKFGGKRVTGDPAQAAEWAAIQSRVGHVAVGDPCGVGAKVAHVGSHWCGLFPVDCRGVPLRAVSGAW